MEIFEALIICLTVILVHTMKPGRNCSLRVRLQYLLQEIPHRDEKYLVQLWYSFIHSLKCLIIKCSLSIYMIHSSIDQSESIHTYIYIDMFTIYVQPISRYKHHPHTYLVQKTKVSIRVIKSVFLWCSHWSKTSSTVWIL